MLWELFAEIFSWGVRTENEKSDLTEHKQDDLDTNPLTLCFQVLLHVAVYVVVSMKVGRMGGCWGGTCRYVGWRGGRACWCMIELWEWVWVVWEALDMAWVGAWMWECMGSGLGVQVDGYWA